MMTREQHLLTKLAEEASEVAQIALKTQQFGQTEQCPGLDQNNRQRVHAELNDLLTLVNMLNNEFAFGFEFDTEAEVRKRFKVNKYYAYSRELGKTE